MDDNGTYLVVRCLQRAGQWDLAARHAPEGSVLRAEVLTDRHLWRLDPVGEACAAIRAIAAQHPDRAAFLTAQLEYWRRLAGQGGDPIGPDPVDTFQSLTGSRALTGWATFWHAVALDNLNGDASAAGPGYAQARDLAVAAGDGLLESYAVRHLAGQALDAGEPERAVPLARRSLHLRAAAGVRPHVAAAQAMLADALDAADALGAARPDGGDGEAAQLRAMVAATARELGLTWLLPGD